MELARGSLIYHTLGGERSRHDDDRQTEIIVLTTRCPVYSLRSIRRVGTELESRRLMRVQTAATIKRILKHWLCVNSFYC